MNTIENDTTLNQSLITILEEEDEEKPYEDQFTIHVVPQLQQHEPQSCISWKQYLLLQCTIYLYIVLFTILGVFIYICVSLYKSNNR